MKKLIITALILALSLLLLPGGTFAGQGNGNGALVCPREPGADIWGLVFDFQDPYPPDLLPECNGLPIDLPDGDGNIATECITCAAVVAEGGELIIVTPSGRYNYDAKLEGMGGRIYATDDPNVVCVVGPDDPWPPEWTEASYWSGDVSDGTLWTFTFDSATLNEHFIIEDGEIDKIMMESPDPCDKARKFEVPPDRPLDLFFKVKGATLIVEEDDDVIPLSPPFDLMLKFNDSLPQIFKIKY